MRQLPIYTLDLDVKDADPDAYGRFTGPVDLGGLPPYLTRGNVVALRPPRGCSAAEVAEVVDQVARRVVNAPVALWVDCVGRRAGTLLASAARPLGVRTVVWACEPGAEVLRRQLTDASDWPEAAVLWAHRRGFDVTPDAAAALKCFARNAAVFRSMAALARARRISFARWQRAFIGAGLGPQKRGTRRCAWSEWHLKSSGIPKARSLSSPLPSGSPAFPP